MKCPICTQDMVITEDESEGVTWRYCPNPNCTNMEHYLEDSLENYRADEDYAGFVKANPEYYGKEE